MSPTIRRLIPNHRRCQHRWLRTLAPPQVAAPSVGNKARRSMSTALWLVPRKLVYLSAGTYLPGDFAKMLVMREINNLSDFRHTGK